jgi:hypothetical protein
VDGIPNALAAGEDRSARHERQLEAERFSDPLDHLKIGSASTELDLRDVRTGHTDSIRYLLLRQVQPDPCLGARSRECQSQCSDHRSMEHR